MDIIRRCPACDKKTLRESLTRRSRVPIDRCTVCAGIWLDGKELERILKGLAVKNLDVPLDAKYSLRYCPNCKEQMHKFLYPQTYAEIDMCEKCKGIWLDVSEYKEIMVVRKSLKQKGQLVEDNNPHGLKRTIIKMINEAIESLM